MLKDRLAQSVLEVKQLKEKLQMAKENEGKMVKNHQKCTSELIQDRIRIVQQLQIEVTTKDSEMVIMNKKIKNLNYTITLYKEQIEKFNKRR